MATVITHAVAAGLLGKFFLAKKRSFKFWFFLYLCAMIPDLDVIGFELGVPYHSFWGHRGFSHSILFAVILGLVIGLVFYKKKEITTKSWWGLVALYSLVILSHGLFDAMTDGGLGIAFFSPFDQTRYFFTWQPISVSPLGINNQFLLRAVLILKSEFIYIISPLCVLLGLKIFFKKCKTTFL